MSERHRFPPRKLGNTRRQLNSKNECLGLALRAEGAEPMGMNVRLRSRRMERLCCSTFRHILSPFGGGIVAMDLDKTEDRYLLAGGADTTLALFDTHSGLAKGALEQVFSLTRSTSPHAHKFMISDVAWYPVDTGMFVTASHDCSVKLWDTNTQDVVSSYALPGKASSVSMSVVAASHCLVAMGCEDTHVRLGDPLSGAVTHVFSGHRHPVWCVAWSAYHEYELLSGDGHGQIRLWDVRRAGCRALLDQYCTVRPAAAAAPGGSAEDPPLPPLGGSASKKRRKGAAPLRGSTSAPSLLAPAADSKLAEAAITAHSGAVTCILPSPCTPRLLTAGTDGRLRLWDAEWRVNRLVGYEHTHNRALRARRLAVTEDARHVFYPTGSSVNVYDTERGSLVRSMQGAHTESINCVAWNASCQELYSGGNDKRIVVWGVGSGEEEEQEQEEGGGQAAR